LNITLDPTDTVSQAIFRQGIYDLVTTEVLWRLASAGDCIIDVGANIGYMTSIFAIRAGACGSVFAFEPHPRTFEILKQSVEYWTHHELCAPDYNHSDGAQ
jgi:predicted methyltransferase